MEKLTSFFKDSWVELTENVTWPSWASLQASASLVLVASLIFALVVGLVDFVIENGLRMLYESI